MIRSAGSALWEGIPDAGHSRLRSAHQPRLLLLRYIQSRVNAGLSAEVSVSILSALTASHKVLPSTTVPHSGLEPGLALVYVWTAANLLLSHCWPQEHRQREQGGAILHYHSFSILAKKSLLCPQSKGYVFRLPITVLTGLVSLSTTTTTTTYYF